MTVRLRESRKSFMGRLLFIVVEQASATDDPFGIVYRTSIIIRNGCDRDGLSYNG